MTFLKEAEGTRCSREYLESFRYFCTKFIQTLQDDYVGGKLLLSTIDEIM
jgi:hypothetical protein